MMKKKILLALSLLAVLQVSARRTCVFAYFADEAESVYKDENVAVEINAGVWTVYNLTDRAIYVDKGNSFYYVNGVPTCMFSNQSYTRMEGKGGGVSVNLGSVANAVGIGGAAGGLLNGVNVGGGRTSSNATTTWEQRVLVIAPKSSIRLHEFDVSKNKPANWKPRKRGRMWNFTKATSLGVYRGVLCYSASETFEDKKQVSVENYIYNITYDKPNSYRDHSKRVYSRAHMDHSYQCWYEINEPFIVLCIWCPPLFVFW